MVKLTALDGHRYMDTLTLFFAFFFIIHLFFTSGFAVRWLFVLSSVSWSKRDMRSFPDALEAITGYALTALLCFLSLLAFGTLFYGGILACILSYAAVIYFYSKYPQLRRHRFRLTPALAVKIAYLSIILFIYLPCLVGLSTTFKLPAIYDLPKQIAAIIAAAHAEQWPAPNPYFPELSFAYNLLFYLPLGLVVRSLDSVKFFLPIFACAVLWVSWQTLSMLEMIMEKFGFSRRGQILGLLFATFVSGFIPLMFSIDTPLGFYLRLGGVSDLWVDNPLISSIFVPQYLFCSMCILGAWLIFNTPVSWLRSILFSLLLGIAVLSGYILAPIIYMLFILLLSLDLFTSNPRSNYKKCLVSLLLFFGLTGYFVWQAKNWSGNAAALLGWPIHFGWHYLMLSEGILVLGCLFSLSFLRENLRTRLGLSYGLLCIATLVVLFLSHDTDFGVKSTLFLRQLLILPATAGFIWCWSKLKQKVWLKWLVLVMPMSYLCCLNVVLIGFFCANSYLFRDAQEKHLLKKMQKLPFDATILFMNPDMEKAAVSGHLVYMDFSGYREDAYLPSKERLIAHKFFQSNRETTPLEGKKIQAIYSNNAFMVGQPSSSSLKTISLSMLNQWQSWISDPQLKISYEMATHTINSGSHIVDAALITPLKLFSGIYQIEVEIVGKVEEGSGHISLHGFKKLITIPAADFKKPAKFTAIFEIGDPGFEGGLAFGLGGWTIGMGNIQLKNLVINKLSFS